MGRFTFTFEHMQILHGEIGKARLGAAGWAIPFAQFGASLPAKIYGERIRRARGPGDKTLPRASTVLVCACGLYRERL